MNHIIANRTLIFTSLGVFICGMLTFFFYNSWIIVSFPGFSKTESGIVLAPIEKKKTIIYYPSNNKFKQESKEVLWSINLAPSLTNIVKNWIYLVDEENLLPQQNNVQALSLDSRNHELFLSFDGTILSSEASTYQNLMMIQSLFKTISHVHTPVSMVQLLSHHVPLLHDRLDFSHPWPINGYLEQQSPPQIQKPLPRRSVTTIMIDPAGDAQNPGRIINESFERTLTLHCAEAIKQRLEREMPSVRVILTRVPGETVDRLQNAAFANRLKADLYLHISFYPITTKEVPLSCYYYLYNPISDYWSSLSTETFIAYNQAYRVSLNQSAHLATTYSKELTSLAQSSGIVVKNTLGCPYKPLIGITIPSMAVEVGIESREQSKAVANYLCDALKQLIKKEFS